MMDFRSLKVVPWFSTEEWDYVCKLVYSESVTEQTKGYEHLLVWKARVAALPASVTCTLELLQVRLQDQVLWPRIASGEVPPYAEQELRLAYSTVIMRFLNHLASLFQNTKNQTLYSVAKKLHIPAWVVNIRHDAAHDGNVPSVDVLRLAAGYALSWLHEYWWKPEALSLLDWKAADTSVDEDTSQVELCDLLDLWQALALYQETDYSCVDHIPDKDVSTQVSILYSKMNSKSHSNESKPDSEIEVTADYNCTRGMSIHVASSLVLQYLKTFVREIDIFQDWDQILLNRLVGEEMFNASLLSDEDWSCVENNKLPRRSLKMWEPVLARLPVAVLLHLMQKLLKLTCSVNGVVSNRSRLAALWIRELAKAIFKLRQVLNLVDETNAAASRVSESAKNVKLSKGIFVNVTQDDNMVQLTSKSLRKMLFARVETDCPDLKDVLVLDVKVLPNKKETYEVVKFAVLNPSQLTPIFLPSVLKLVDLPAPADTHCNLMLLVDLYTEFVNADVEVDVDAPVFTVSHLTSSSTMLEPSTARDTRDPVSRDSGVEDMEVEESGHLDQQKSSQQKQNVLKSHWCRAEANPKWSTCPLGVLPWQRGQTWVDLTSPEYTWQLSEDITAVGNINKLPKLFHKAIEWEDAKRRRLKKKGNLKLNRKIVETALETVSQSTVGRCFPTPKNIP